MVRVTSGMASKVTYLKETVFKVTSAIASGNDFAQGDPEAGHIQSDPYHRFQCDFAQGDPEGDHVQGDLYHLDSQGDFAHKETQGNLETITLK